MPEYGNVNCFQLILHRMEWLCFCLLQSWHWYRCRGVRCSVFVMAIFRLGMNLKFPCQTSCFRFFPLSIWRRVSITIVRVRVMWIFMNLFMFFFSQYFLFLHRSSVNSRWMFVAHKYRLKTEQNSPFLCEAVSRFRWPLNRFHPKQAFFFHSKTSHCATMVLSFIFTHLNFSLCSFQQIQRLNHISLAAKHLCDAECSGFWFEYVASLSIELTTNLTHNAMQCNSKWIESLTKV